MLASEKKNELTVIFLEEEQPRKKHKPNPSEGENLPKEDKLKRLFNKLSQGKDVEIIDGPQRQLARIPGAASNEWLTNFIDTHQSTCLNVVDTQNWIQVLTSANSRIDSDCDDQLLISICFSKPCRLHSLKFRAPNDGTGPGEVRLFVNQSNLDFNNVVDFTPVQTLKLTQTDFGPDNITLLEPGKFRKVKFFSLFVVGNAGGFPQTTLYQVQFIGKPE